MFCGFGVVGSRRKSQQKSVSGEPLDRIHADALLVARSCYLAGQGACVDRVILCPALRKAAEKPAQLLAPDAVLELTTTDFPWVSRGALKLIGGLDAFAQIDPAGRTCLDIWASTGGFTEVLLDRGAMRVVALDVGRDQLHPSLSGDPLVIVMDGVNACDLRQKCMA